MKNVDILQIHEILEGTTLKWIVQSFDVSGGDPKKQILWLEEQSKYEEFFGLVLKISQLLEIFDKVNNHHSVSPANIKLQLLLNEPLRKKVEGVLGGSGVFDAAYQLYIIRRGKSRFAKTAIHKGNREEFTAKLVAEMISATRVAAHG